MEEGAKVDVKKFIRYEPVPICKVLIHEGSITRGDWIPEIGQVEKITDDEGCEIDRAEAREDHQYVITTKVTDENFKGLMPHLQWKLLLCMIDKIQRWSRSAYNKHGLGDDTLETDENDPDKEEDIMERFYKEFGMKKFKTIR